MAKAKFNSKAHIAAFNALRAKFADTIFSSSTIRIELKELGIPSNHVFWSFLQNSDLIVKITTDKFCFSNPTKPVHYHKLDQIYTEYNKKVNVYHNNWKDSKSQKDLFKQPDIQNAIKLLQEYGFIIGRKI